MLLFNIFSFPIMFFFAIKTNSVILATFEFSLANASNMEKKHIFIPTQKRTFSGVYLNQPVCPPVCVSVWVQNASSCQRAGGGYQVIFSDSSSFCGIFSKIMPLFNTVFCKSGIVFCAKPKEVDPIKLNSLRQRSLSIALKYIINNSE